MQLRVFLLFLLIEVNDKGQRPHDGETKGKSADKKSHEASGTNQGLFLHIVHSTYVQPRGSSSAMFSSAMTAAAAR